MSCCFCHSSCGFISFWTHSFLKEVLSDVPMKVIIAKDSKFFLIFPMLQNLNLKKVMYFLVQHIWTDSHRFFPLQPLRFSSQMGLCLLCPTVQWPGSLFWHPFYSPAREERWEFVCLHLDHSRTGLSESLHSTMEQSLDINAYKWVGAPPHCAWFVCWCRRLAVFVAFLMQPSGCTLSYMSS